MTGDLETLQGSWLVTGLEMNGMAMPQTMLGGAQIIVAGDHFTTKAMGAEYGGRVEINDSASPRQFDLIFADGPLSGTQSLGIFTLADDVWTICLTVTAQTRPTAFATTAGDGLALEVLKRG